MWERNLDTGKWSEQIDQLPKDYYDGIKQDIQTVRLYSKCLSGSVYMMIDDFDNIYNTLDIDKIGYYIKPNLPIIGPQLEINSQNYEEFYQRYLREYAFTIKNFFTSTKLIESESKNIVNVDLATTQNISDLSSFNQTRYVDGVRLLEGHKILVKDQITEVTLSTYIDEEDYFTNTILVSNYYLKESNVLDNTYYYYNSENGIYKYTSGLLVKEINLSNYNNSYKLNVMVNYGGVNSNKQYHVLRLKNNYFPKEGENVEFKEMHNWILRHRLDYNNVLELNYYDMLDSKATLVYDRFQNFTYSIPDRLIAVGEFGVILNNQDKIDPNNNYETSNIVNSKYKVNLRSIAESNDYYWVCGDEGTLLKIYKPDFQITRIDLNIYTQLTSITFFDNLNGFVVGKFNKIYFTSDGGERWTQLNYPEYESYSFTSVKFKDLNNVYISGSTGLFLELTRDNNNWVSYKRQIYKTQENGDYLLVDDVYDVMLMNWVGIEENSYSENKDSLNFAESLSFNYKITSLSHTTLQLGISSKYFGNEIFGFSRFYIGLSMSDVTGLIFSDPNFYQQPSVFSENDYSLFKSFGEFVSYSKQINLNKTIDGNLSDKVINIEARIFYNYNGVNNSVNNTFNLMTLTYSILPTKSELVLLPTFDKVIVYNSKKLYQNTKSNFLYFEFDKIIGEIRTIDRPKISNDSKIYIASDKIYYFDLKDIISYQSPNSNYVLGKLFDGPDIYVNRLLASDRLYLAGNDSNLKYSEYTSIGTTNITEFWDPDFNQRYKSKFLFLDYDIASKLNFFTDQGQYRLPQSIVLSSTSLSQPGDYFELNSSLGQKSWVDYYKDSEKTFEYYTRLSDDKKVEFSTKFTLTSTNLDFEISQNLISNKLSDIIQFAPSVVSSTASEFSEGVNEIITTTEFQLIQPPTLSSYDLLIYKNIIIFKRGVDDITEVGDYIRLESDIVDVNLLVNKINIYYQPPGAHFRLVTSIPRVASNSVLEKYIYCFHNLNGNIINNLLDSNKNLSFKILNKFYSVDDLLDKFEKHPISIGYRISDSNGDLQISPRFNNKTAYYNLSCEVSNATDTFTLSYTEAFNKFGFTPNYSLLDYLNNLDSNLFTPDKKFTILPEHYDILVVTQSSFSSTSIKLDPLKNSNKLYFGVDLKFEWESILLWTFYNIRCLNLNGEDKITERMLVVAKYFDESSQIYVIEFHKSILLPDLSSGLSTINILSRNTLSEISEDLQLLNNIQRSSSTKTIGSTFSFTNLENEVKLRFPTDSYLKALVSDYDIQQNLSGIVYTDGEYKLAVNILNVEKELFYDFNAIIKNYGGNFTNKVTYVLKNIKDNILKVGDMVYIELTGTYSTSKELNPQYQGYQTIVDVDGDYVTTTMEYGVNTPSNDTGYVKFIKKDAFLNYLPIDLYDIGSDKKPKQSVEIVPEMIKLENSVHSLINVDTKKLKLKFVDGLFLQEIEEKYSWFLQADTSPAIIGKDENGLKWYLGTWKCGQWFSGTWVSGDWLSGDWYGGKWYSSRVKPGVSSVEISNVSVDDTLSKWQGGRWFGGIWYGGSWYDGRRYGGDWNGGKWFNGIWNDGNWYGGTFQGGIWVLGKWFGGKFNCDSKLSYWLDGSFTGGDFENGTWYNGQFGIENLIEGSIVPRFGTKSINTRITTWHGGKWLNGEFHSYLNVDSTTQMPMVSDIHSLTIWRTGLWLGGDFYGGIAYNIDFRGGIWHGGILEELQVVGVDKIYPGTFSNNKIYVNGVFKFNTGDEIYIIDDDRNTDFSPIGNNTTPRKYRINKIEELSSQTGLFLNFDLSSLNPSVSHQVGDLDWSNYETGLRIVSHFESSIWKSGIWSNGYFESGTFEGGIWYNGIMEAIMGK